MQSDNCLLLLAFIVLESVNIKARKRDIGFGHGDGITKVYSPVAGRGSLAEELACKSGMVAAGAYKIKILDIAYVYPADELLDKARHSPGVYGEHKAYRLTISHGKGGVVCQYIGDEKDIPIVEFPTESAGNPVTVSGS